MERCACCLKENVGPAEARVSVRSLGRVLCAKCRLAGRVPDPDHEREEVLESDVAPRGAYGLWAAQVRTAAGVFEGFGQTARQALQRAHTRAGLA
ncbi:MAG: hypothetical protein ACK47B_09200 [Armatimonadota bacterium]